MVLESQNQVSPKNDKSQNKLSPINSNKSQIQDSPLNSNKSQNRISPINSNKSQNLATVNSNKSQNKISPINSNKSQNLTTINSNKSQNKITPINSNKSQNKISPINSNKSQNKISPINSNKSQIKDCSKNDNKNLHSDCPKNDDVSTFKIMFARVTFLPSLFYNMLMARVTSRKWYDRIDDTVVLGALPFRSVTRKLVKEEGVSAVVSMNEQYELRFCTRSKGWTNLGIEFLQLSTTDIFAAPCQSKLIEGVKFINKYKDSDSTVYVHCKAGRTRSATLVACYLMDRYKYTPKQSVNYIKDKRPHILLRSKQWEAIHNYYKYMKDTK